MAEKPYVSAKELTETFSEIAGQVPFELTVRLTFGSIYHRPKFCFKRLPLFSKKWEIFLKQKNKELAHDGKSERVESFEDCLKFFSLEMYREWMNIKRKRKTNIV